MFQTSRRVEFGDTDMAGIVHFSNFFRYMEAAETDFLRSLGWSVLFERDGVKWGFPRVSVGCEYARPARFGDVLTVGVGVERVGRKSVAYRFEFGNERGEALAVGRITAVCCREAAGGGLESAPIPDELRVLLEARASG